MLPRDLGSSDVAGREGPDEHALTWLGEFLTWHVAHGGGQEKGAEKILYGLDDVRGCEEIIVVEGEMDKLALEEAGFLNVVSVPDGAPAQVLPPFLFVL